MIDIQQFIASGIIEEYCLGIANNTNTQQLDTLRLQYPELEAEIAATQAALLQYAIPVPPPLPSNGLKNSILSVLDNFQVEAKFDIHNLPNINRHSDISLWNKHLAHLKAEEPYDNMFIQSLSQTPEKNMFLVWLKSDLKEEKHEDCQESLLLLEGECYFKTGLDVTFYKAGDFVTVPKVDHQVVVTSKTPLKFVVQHLLKAA